MKTAHSIEIYFTRVSALFMPSKGFFSEKPTTPSFRAYFIILIDALVSWNYQLINRIINNNWNGGKFYAFLLSWKRDFWWQPRKDTTSPRVFFTKKLQAPPPTFFFSLLSLKTWWRGDVVTWYLFEMALLPFDLST